MMLTLTPIVERLRGAGYRNVAGLLEFADQRETPRALPALFVVPIIALAAPILGAAMATHLYHRKPA